LRSLGRSDLVFPYPTPLPNTKRLSHATSNLLKLVTPIPQRHHSPQISSLPIPSAPPTLPRSRFARTANGADLQLFPGLIYRMMKPKVVLLIFVSGKIVLTGAKVREEIYMAFNQIYSVLVGESCALDSVPGVLVLPVTRMELMP
jgi:hypothetical protein